MKKADKLKLADKHRAAMRKFMATYGIETMADWARASGVNQGTITNFLKEKNPSESMGSDNLHCLASCMGATISEMLGEIGSANKVDDIDCDILQLSVERVKENAKIMGIDLSSSQFTQAICKFYKIEILKNEEEKNNG